MKKVVYLIAEVGPSAWFPENSWASQPAPLGSLGSDAKRQCLKLLSKGAAIFSVDANGNPATLNTSR